MEGRCRDGGKDESLRKFLHAVQATFLLMLLWASVPHAKRPAGISVKPDTDGRFTEIYAVLKFDKVEEIIEECCDHS